MGSLGAAYKFLLDFAAKQGCTSVDLGLCRSGPLDGVFVHKKHWGATLVDRPEVTSDLLVKWRSDFAGLMPWLVRNPLIVRDGKRLSALSAVPAGSTSEDCHNFVNRLSCPGLKRLLLLGSPTGAPSSPHGASVEFLNPEDATGQHCLK